MGEAGRGEEWRGRRGGGGRGEEGGGGGGCREGEAERGRRREGGGEREAGRGEGEGLTCSRGSFISLIVGVSNIMDAHDSTVTMIISQSKYVTMPSSSLESTRFHGNMVTGVVCGYYRFYAIKTFNCVL